MIDNACMSPKIRYGLYTTADDETEVHRVTEYIKSCGFDSKPMFCIKANHPSWVKKLPSIVDTDGNLYQGLDACLKFYEIQSGINDLHKQLTSYKD